MKKRERRGGRSVMAVLRMVLVAGAMLVFSGHTAWAATDLQWTWMKGSSSAEQPGVYGTILTPAAVNSPGGRQNAATWLDGSGNLWLFGGLGWSSNGTGSLNDLWKYDAATGKWTWMKGANVCDQNSVRGTLLTAAAANTPGSRYSCATWVDKSGNLWLFGGYGRDDSGEERDLNDLWKYDCTTGNWTWMKGSGTGDQKGTRGAILTPDAANTPGGRYGGVSWVDGSGNLWLFGGYGVDDGDLYAYMNDLWKYEVTTGNWTWMKGSGTGGQNGIYGTQLVAAAANTPGGRGDAVSWVDGSGGLWLFGGVGFAGAGTESNLNDLWKYNISTGNWTWMKGAPITGQAGTYGTILTADPLNTPGARNSATGWTDAAGNLWLFGGFGRSSSPSGYLNDLWKYDAATGNWAWMKGASSPAQPGVYGTVLTPAAANTPGSRSCPSAWSNPATGALWLFGGLGFDGAGAGNWLNDLWRITVPDTTAPTGTVSINANQSVTNSLNVTLGLTWADKGGSGAVRMKFSNDAVTWSAWEPLLASKAWTLPAGEGYHTVRVMFRDAAGNNSAVYSDFIRVDTVPPTGSIIINSGAATTTNSTVSLGLAWSDGTGSGVTRMRFSTDGAHWTTWEPQKASKSFKLPSAAPGYYTVRAQFLDAGNNYSPVYSDYIKLVSP